MRGDKIKQTIQQKAESKGFLSNRDTICKKILKNNLIIRSQVT